MTGKIIKGIGGFYYVVCENEICYECKAKGIFRNQNIKPLVGDNVEIEILDDTENLGNIVKILPRFNWLIRPAVSNVDQTVVIFAVSEPEPNFNLLDRFLVNMEQQNVPAKICFNKVDLEGFTKNKETCLSYTKSGYEVLFVSTLNGYGIKSLKNVIKGRTTVFAGPSGVGKSSVLNAVSPEADVKTGDLSEKLKRGKHTTRHSELMYVSDGTYIMDTPGFSSLYIEGIEEDDLKEYFPEIASFTGKCKFNMCNHINEPGCLVKEAVKNDVISEVRYNNYVSFFNELKERKKW